MQLNSASEEKLDPNSTSNQWREFTGYVNRGDRVKSKPHGTTQQIEFETLRILKQNRRRFNRFTEDRTEFTASRYLTKVIAKEEASLKEKYEEDKQKRDCGKPKALFKYLEWNKRKAGHVKSQRLKKLDENKSQSSVALKKTFIPFIQERDTCGNVFNKTLINQEMRSSAEKFKSRQKPVQQLEAMSRPISETYSNIVNGDGLNQSNKDHMHIEEDSVTLAGHDKIQSNQAYLVQQQLLKKDAWIEDNSLMAKGDVILPSNLTSARMSSFDANLIDPGSRE